MNANFVTTVSLVIYKYLENPENQLILFNYKINIKDICKILYLHNHQTT